VNERLSRRDVMRILGASGLAAGLSGLAGPRPLPAQTPGEASGFTSSVIAERTAQPNRASPTLVDGKVIQPQRELTVLHQTGVLVVGAGPAGVTAAIAAKRAGADVTLVERYGHFGGLWTGGLVLKVEGHITKDGKQVCQGIGEEIMRRLEKIDGGMMDRRPGVNPTVDAEALKYIMLEMIEEAGIKVFLHAWGVDAIVDGNAVRGAVLESKSGRQAILARTVVDTTGDGDLFAAAGAEFQLRSHNVGLVSRIGNVDKIDPTKAKGPKPKGLGGATPMTGINWVNLRGPEVDGLNVTVLTEWEMKNRKHIWQSVQKLRATPGYEKLQLVETAPQLGVRITRVLAGLQNVSRKDLNAGAKFPDVVAVGGAVRRDHGEWQIPYGCLVPEKIDNLLAAGRCISAEMQMADLVRLIPNCLVTGHAAGVAAAVAVQDDCRPRDVDVTKVQRVLRQQEAYLG
jgi:flavin-dependent dehydrogenase